MASSKRRNTHRNTPPLSVRTVAWSSTQRTYRGLVLHSAYVPWPRPRLNVRTVVSSSTQRTYRGLVLVQHLVVLAHGYTEDDGRHVLETVNPFLPLRPLTTHIEQPAEHETNAMTSHRQHNLMAKHKIYLYSTRRVRSNVTAFKRYQTNLTSMICSNYFFARLSSEY